MELGDIIERVTLTLLPFPAESATAPRTPEQTR